MVEPARLPREVYVILARVRLEQIERRLTTDATPSNRQHLADQRGALRRFLGEPLDTVQPQP
jgi:hypothetical protein